MIYRQIYINIWHDPWFQDLDGEGKLLYIYLFSNERTNVLGLYEISRRTIAFDTDLPRDVIDDWLAKFEAMGKARVSDNWIWIPNLITRNTNNLSSEKIQAHVKKALAALSSSCPLIQEWVEHYNQVIAPRYNAAQIALPEYRIDTVSTDTDTVSTDTDTVSEDEDTVSVDENVAVYGISQEQEQELDLEQDLEHEHDLEQGEESAASAARTRAPPTNGPHLAIEAYRSVMELYPAKTTWAGVIAAVGDDPADVERWRETCLAWSMSGWNPMNVRGILKYFAAETLPGDDPELMVYEKGES